MRSAQAPSSLGARSLAEGTLSEGVSFRAAGVEGGLQNKIDNSRQKSTESRKVPLPAHHFYGGVPLTLSLVILASIHQTCNFKTR